MNWTMGRYIDWLDIEGRDRLIGAPEFNDGVCWWTNGCGCLVGTAAHWPELDEASRARHSDAFDSLSPNRGVRWDRTKPAARYPYAVKRFGKARVVRAIKLRAARLNGCDPETIARLLEQPQSEAVR